ncbi:MAG: hypothetical protein IJT59_02745 [Desulfovibrionaceae bacterium]|nr:hypothetical protein [Desulfovibrionaceae bacterium]
MHSDQRPPQKRPSLREDVMAIDRQILNLLLRRYNMLQRMRGTRGHLIPIEEKQLREAWQAEVAKISPDPNLSTQLFELIQNLRFFPKPKEGQSEKKAPSKQAFNLAPSKKPVYFTLDLPAAHDLLHTQLTAAAFAGGEIYVEHTLMDDGQHALLRILKELGGDPKTSDDSLTFSAQKPANLQDLSLHVGSDILNFYLLAAQYLVRSSRIRFTAEDQAKKEILTPITRFCPTLGARLSYGVPRIFSFPVRLECSGVLPKQIKIPADLPSQFVLALILALPNAESQTTIDLKEHDAASAIITQGLALLENWEAKAFQVGDKLLEIWPSELKIPHDPYLPADLTLTSFILSLPLFLGGICTLHGSLPDTEKAQDIQAIFQDLGLKINPTKTNTIHIQSQGLALTKDVALPWAAEKFFKDDTLELMVMLAAALALTDHEVKLPNLPTTAQDFIDAVGLKLHEDGLLKKKAASELKIPLYTAPNAAWALAYANCAALRQVESFKLSNAGIITKIWPKYWALYNGLPAPNLKKEPPQETKPHRIITQTIIQPKDQDDDF